MPHTVTFHRVLRAPAERLYRAFTDPDALVKWQPPHGFTGRVLATDLRVGGAYRMSFTNFNTGTTRTFGGTYVELAPGERLVYTDQFDNPNLPGTLRTTVCFKPVSCGTELTITQAGLPDMIPPEACTLGWQESLELLARLVEPEIPDGG